jgi:hypothetical protein
VHDDSDSDIAYAGNWQSTDSSFYPAAFGGTTRYATGPGATATLSFKGRSVGVVAPENGALGTVRICVDPGTASESCKTVDENAGAADRVLVFTRNGLDPSKTHELRVTANTGIADLDAIVVLK